MAYRLIMAYHISHLKMKCATCILHCETKTKTGYASMASRSRDSSILWAALAQRRHASSPCGHSRCSNPSSQGCAEYKVKDVLHNEKPTLSHHAENPCHIFHSMIPQSWQPDFKVLHFYMVSQFLHPWGQPSFTACSTKVIRLLGSLGQRAARFKKIWEDWNGSTWINISMQGHTLQHALNLKEPLPTLPPLPFKLSIRNCNANCNAKVCQVSTLLSNASQASARRFRARCCANTAFRTAKPQIPHDLCFSLASPDTDLFKMVKAC